LSTAKRKKKLGNYPYVSVVFSITIALFVIGLFGLLIIYTGQLSQNIRDNVQIQVFLERYVTENERIRIQKVLGDKPFVLKKDGQPQIEFISKDQAAEDFIKDTGEDFTEFLGENPLRDGLMVNINSGYHNADSLKVIQSEITSIRGVYEVTYVENLIESINSNIAKISLIILAFTLILLAVIYILIDNTIKLALFSQRFLIRSMQLVGAKMSFIIKPFLRRSMIHGLISGVLASILLVALVFYGNQRIEELGSIQNNELNLMLFGVLIVLGVVIAVVSTYRAIKKYLKMSLDELY